MAESGDSKYSITEVAKMLGVSASTVSRALNGKKGVGSEQRQKILRLAEEIGYQPNTLIHHRRSGNESKLVGLIVGDIRNPFYADLEFHLHRILSEKGYMTVIFNSEYNVEHEVELLKMAEQVRFAGIIMVTAQSEALQKTLAEMTIPKVLVNRNLPSYTGDSVLIDNFQAGYLAAMHLIDLSHRRIGFARGPLVSSASSQRFEGFKQALANFGLPLVDEYIFDCELVFDGGRRCGEKFLKRKFKERPTGMVLANDNAALGFVDICRKHGLSIPEDLSVVSFDDIIYSSIEGIRLTTVSQHVEEMSREAARLILKQLNGDTGHPERVIITPELIVRDTATFPADK